MMNFEVFAWDVGGGTLALSSMPPDGRAVTEWDAVLSMTQAQEMSAGLKHDLHAMGDHWLHFPVADFGAPNGENEWRVIERAVLTMLAQKRRVLVHCKGGCGRSGMAVLRLMIAAGEDPADAFARLRAVRPCAVETEAQLAWASGASLPWRL